MKTQAVRIHRHGGPEVMQLDEIDLPEPAAGHVRIRNTCIGVNYADIYEREGITGAAFGQGPADYDGAHGGGRH